MNGKLALENSFWKWILRGRRKWWNDCSKLSLSRLNNAAMTADFNKQFTKLIKDYQRGFRNHILNLCKIKEFNQVMYVKSKSYKGATINTLLHLTKLCAVIFRNPQGIFEILYAWYLQFHSDQNLLCTTIDITAYRSSFCQMLWVTDILKKVETFPKKGHWWSPL